MKSTFQIPVFSIALAAPLWAAHPAVDSARRSLEARIPEVALAELSIALAQPDFPSAERDEALLLTAEAMLRVGKAADAITALEGAQGRKAVVLRAHAFAADGRWAEALAEYETAGESRSNPVSAAVGCAEALQVLGRTPEAVVVLEKLIASGSAPTSARLRHAGLLAELGRLSEAGTLLDAIKPEGASDTKWRDYVKARILLAAAARQGDAESTGRWQDALDALERIAAEPDGMTPNLHAAIVLAATEARLKLGNQGSESAARALETFLWNFPDNPAIEMIFRRLDQINARDRSPRETELHKMARERDGETRKRAVLAQFYVCRMQLREKTRRQYVATSIEQFLTFFPNDRLTTYVYEMQADLALINGQFDAALTSLEAAQRTALERERSAHLEMRMGLAAFQKGDPSLAATYFRLAAEHSIRLQKSAAFNAALSELARKNLAGFQSRFSEFAASYGSDSLAGELLLESGFMQAREGNAGAPIAIRAFLTDYPTHPRIGEAHLALAEIHLASGLLAQSNAGLADARAVEASDASGGQQERNRYAEIFAADAARPRDADNVKSLAHAFISDLPQSLLLADVRMKLGQIYFHEQDFANAGTQFETLAKEKPDGAYAETALFLAGQCAARRMGKDSAERAVALFTQVVERKGPLRYYALFQQGLIQDQLEKDGTVIFQTILDAQPPVPDELRFATLCAKGDNLVKVAKGAPEKLGAALASYTQLAGTPDAGPEWHNQAVYKQGRVLAQLGRQQEALVLFSRLLDESTAGAKETFWLYKAGFEAAGMLEAQGSWRSAFGIYEKLGGIPGSRAAEAKAKVKELRLKRFIWD